MSQGSPEQGIIPGLSIPRLGCPASRSGSSGTLLFVLITSLVEAAGVSSRPDQILQFVDFVLGFRQSTLSRRGQPASAYLNVLVPWQSGSRTCAEVVLDDV